MSLLRSDPLKQWNKGLLAAVERSTILYRYGRLRNWDRRRVLSSARHSRLLQDGVGARLPPWGFRRPVGKLHREDRSDFAHQQRTCLAYKLFQLSIWSERTCIELKQDDRASHVGDRAMKNWPQITKELSAQLRNLRGGAPEVMKAFSGMAQAAVAAKALDSKTKELIALGIAVAVRCDDCIGFHVKAAVEHGASEEEVIEVLGMAIYMGAGPSVMYACHALEAFGQFANAAPKT